MGGGRCTLPRGGDRRKWISVRSPTALARLQVDVAPFWKMKRGPVSGTASFGCEGGSSWKYPHTLATVANASSVSDNLSSSNCASLEMIIDKRSVDFPILFLYFET